MKKRMMKIHDVLRFYDVHERMIKIYTFNDKNRIIESNMKNAVLE